VFVCRLSEKNVLVNNKNSCVVMSYPSLNHTEYSTLIFFFLRCSCCLAATSASRHLPTALVEKVRIQSRFSIALHYWISFPDPCPKCCWYMCRDRTLQQCVVLHLQLNHWHALPPESGKKMQWALLKTSRKDEASEIDEDCLRRYIGKKYSWPVEIWGVWSARDWRIAIWKLRAKYTESK